ncbi:hypothetical protein [Vibrio cholerae]|uniref:hypothetical protein n=1 Tax=Vibrio cholerae TaxID=666 RepID=UPI0030806762
MEAKQMYQLAIWYKENVLRYDISSKLKAFNASITQMLGSTSDMSSKLAHIKTASIKYVFALEQIDVNSLGYDELEILKKLGLNYIILRPSINELNRILQQGDLQEISARMSHAFQTVQTVDGYFKSFLDTFEKIFGSPDESEFFDSNGKVLTRIRFTNDASISNVVDLNNWSERWNTIARGYSMALGQAPESFEVIGASRGSIIFDLLLDFETVKLFSETFNLLTESAFNIAELYAAIKGIEILKKSSPELHKKNLDHIEALIANKKDEMADQVADKLLEKLLNKNKKSDGEVKENLKRSIKELDNFIHKGGDINFRAESDKVEIVEEIQLVNSALKQLQHRTEQKQLEDKSK